MVYTYDNICFSFMIYWYLLYSNFTKILFTAVNNSKPPVIATQIILFSVLFPLYKNVLLIRS